MSDLQKNIIVRAQFEGFHRYKDAPPDVFFLSSFHRHIFHVEVKYPITSDRQLEFFQEKKKLLKFLNTELAGKEFEFSCEMIAELILAKFPYASYASVFEDNENGSEVYRKE